MLRSRQANLPKSSMLAGNRSNAENRTGPPLSIAARLNAAVSAPNRQISDHRSERSEVFNFSCCSTSHKHTQAHTFPAAPPESPSVHIQPPACPPAATHRDQRHLATQSGTEETHLAGSSCVFLLLNTSRIILMAALMCRQEVKFSLQSFLTSRYCFYTHAPYTHAHKNYIN